MLSVYYSVELRVNTSINQPVSTHGRADHPTYACRALTSDHRAVDLYCHLISQRRTYTVEATEGVASPGRIINKQ